MLVTAEKWARGDMLQGRIMLLCGILLLPTLYFVITHPSDFHSGVMIPLILMIIALIGYGGFLAFTRLSHFEKCKDLHSKNPVLAKANELEKARKDDKNYSLMRKIWPVVFLISIVVYFVFNIPFYKGISIGCATLATCGMAIDVFLQNRLKGYLHHLKN